MRAVATLAVHIEEYRKVAPQLVIFQESIQGVENLKARVEELEAKLKAAGQIRDTSDLLVRDILTTLDLSV